MSATCSSVVHNDLSLPKADITEKNTKALRNLLRTLANVYCRHVRKVKLLGQIAGISASVRPINGSFDSTRCSICDSSQDCFSCRERRCRDECYGTQINSSLYIRGDELSGMRAKPRDGVIVGHTAKNTYIINDIVVSSANFGAANLI